jgi:hypothetical protein
MQPSRAYSMKMVILMMMVTMTILNCNRSKSVGASETKEEVRL